MLEWFIARWVLLRFDDGQDIPAGVNPSLLLVKRQGPFSCRLNLDLGGSMLNADKLMMIIEERRRRVAEEVVTSDKREKRGA